MAGVNWIESEVDVSTLRPFERNPRKINDSQYAKLVKSLRENGYHQRILATPDMRIIGGHQRIKALTDLGFTRIRVLTPDRPLTDKEFQRILIQDNLPFGEFDVDMLLTDFDSKQLVDWGMPLSWLGDGRKRTAGKTDADDAPALLPTPVTKSGETWVLGRHRLHCGDATKPEDVAQLLAGVTPDCLLTDPPYCSGGFQEAGKSGGSIGTRQTGAGGEYQGGIANDKLSTRGYTNLLKTVFTNIPAGILYCFTDWRMWNTLFDLAEASGFYVRNMVVWDKETMGMGVGWRMQHELVLVGVRGTLKYDPAKATGNVLRAKRTGNLLHPTQKPVDVLEKIINLTDMAATFCDPFAGSGSVLIAAEKCGRTCYAMEMSPAFCDVIKTRWEEFTGEKATLET